MRQPGNFEKLLRWMFPHKEMGWEDIHEEFVRFTIFQTPWGAVLLHRLDAPTLHPQCHDHPWAFATLILRGGYEEHTDEGIHWRRPGTILYRPATFRHNVLTRRPAWSLVLRTSQKREWQHVDCRTRPD